MLIRLGSFKALLRLLIFIVTQLVGTGFLKSVHILICDNITIHATQESKILAELLWERNKLDLKLSPYSPELNPIELI